MGMTLYRKSTAAAAALVVSCGSTTLRAEPAVASLTVTCSQTGPGVAACVGVGLLLNELVNLANGEKAFGENGAVRKLVEAPIPIIAGNLAATGRESGELDKVLRGVSGISIKDISAHGPLGGSCSFFNKPGGC